MAPLNQTPPSGSKATNKPKKPAPAPIQPALPVHVRPVQRPGVARNSLSPLQWDMDAIGPPEATFYFPIPLGGTTPPLPVTGVFLPNGFTDPHQVDVILFFHGNQRGDKDFPEGWKFDHIDQYWGGNFPKGNQPPVLFRENLNTSGKHSVLLIAPTLGQYPGSSFATDASSDYGKFGDQAVDASGGFLEQVFTKLEEKEPNAKGMTVGKIILCGHSGGGNPLLRQIELMKSTPICEVWAFEAVYTDTDRWAKAITKNTQTKFFFHFATPPQKKRAEDIRDGLANQTNMSLIENPKVATKDHYGALTRNFLDRLNAATCIK